MRTETPAWWRIDPAGQPLAVLVDSPHSGREYPADFGAAAPLELLRRAEDAYVDQLLEDAPRHGATLLCARAPRSYIDVNRALDDLDPAMLEGAWPTALAPTDKSRLGVGLIRRVVSDAQPIYRRLLSVAEVEARIARCWRPYHEELRRLHELLRQRGAVYHLDVHSMKPVGTRSTPDGAGAERVDAVVGDLHGTSCAAALTECVVETLRARGRAVAINAPYAGGAITQVYGAPQSGHHCLQLELNRRLYLDPDRVEVSGGFEALRADLDAVVAAVVALASGAE